MKSIFLRQYEFFGDIIMARFTRFSLNNDNGIFTPKNLEISLSLDRDFFEMEIM